MDEYIFRTGDASNNFYCLLKGKLSVLVPEIGMKIKKDKKDKSKSSMDLDSQLKANKKKSLKFHKRICN